MRDTSPDSTTEKQAAPPGLKPADDPPWLDISPACGDDGSHISVLEAVLQALATSSGHAAADPQSFEIEVGGDDDVLLLGDDFTIPAEPPEAPGQIRALEAVLQALTVPSRKQYEGQVQPEPDADLEFAFVANDEDPDQDPDNDDDDVLLLDEDFEIPAAPPEPPSQIHALEAVLEALTSFSHDQKAEEAAVAAGEDILILDASFLAATPRDAAAPAAHASDVIAAPPLSGATGDAALSAEELRQLIASATPEGAGTLELPERLDALVQLLGNPTDDFKAQDLLLACWPRGSAEITSRALLAVALNLSRNFGLPGKLPMAASKAWRMLDPLVFEAALVQRLEAIAEFIFTWQKRQGNFLILEFGEIELIEHLFETLNPGRHPELLITVMNFKVLSNRRLGLVRRIPGRVRKAVLPMLPADRQGALNILAHVRTLLEQLAHPNQFSPIIEAATRALDEVDKLMKQVAGPPPEGGQP